MAVSIESSGLNQYGWQVGIFCALTCFISTMILNKIRGDFSRLKGFFALKQWEFIEKSPKVDLYCKMFKVIVIFMISWPIWTLLAWGVAVLVAAEENKTSALPGTSILLIGYSIVFLSLGTMYIKFNNFRFTKFSLLCFILGMVFFFAFQLVALVIETPVSFFGLSALFLTLNASIMLIIIQMLQSKSGCNILEIIENRDIVQSGRSLSKEDTEDLDALINQEKDDESYQPTDEEIFELFTLVNENERGEEVFEIEKKLKMIQGTSLGGGLMHSFKKSSAKAKVAKIGILYAVSIGILAAYAILGYKYSKESEKYLSAITAVATIVTDLIIYYMIYCKLTKGVFEITLLMLGFRAFLFGFGGDWWFLGYCCLYLFLGLSLSKSIVNRRFPFNEVYTQKKPRCLDRLKTPEFIQFISFVILALLSLVLKSGDFKNIPTKGVDMFDKTYEFYIFGIAALILNGVVFCYMMSLRIYKRQLKGIKENKPFSLGCKWFSTYYIFLALCYILIVAFGIAIQAMAEEEFVLLSCIVLPLVYESIMIIYFNWQMNDYRLIADISAYNDKMRKYQDIREKQMEKRKALQEQLKKKLEQKAEDGGKPKDSINDMLDDLNNNDQTMQQTADKQQEVQVFVGGAVSHQDIVFLKTNLTTYRDWKEDGLTFWEALKTGKLLKSDYNTIIAIAVLILLLIIYSASTGVTSTHWPLLGVTITVTILTILCLYLPIKQYFATLNKPNLQQIGLGIFGLVVNFGWGGFYYVKLYNNDDEEQGDFGKYYLTYFVFVLPWSISFFTFWKKWKDDKFKFNKFSIIFLVIALVFSIGMGIEFIMVKSLPAGIGILAVWFFFYYALLLLFVYKKSDDSMPRKFIYASLIIIGLVCLSSLVASLFLDEFNDFLGFSISYLTFTLLLFFYSLWQLYQDFENQDKEPIFASPWVFPLYKYNADLGVINKNTRNLSLFLLSCLLITVWSISVSIWIQPTSIGTSLCNLSMCFLFIIIITISSSSSVSLGEAKDKIDGQLIKSCWLSAKREYLKSLNATANSSVITYIDKRKETQNTYKEILDVEKAYSNQDIDYFLDLRDRYQEYYSAEAASDLQFLNEVKFLIHFQLLIILKCDAHKRREMKKFNNFIQGWAADLQILGIIFQKSGNSNRIEDIYNDYRAQYDGLPKSKQGQIDNLFEEFQNEQKSQEGQDEKRSEEEEKKRLEREEQLKKMLEQRNNKEEIDLSQDYKDIPDSPEKFLKILQDFRANQQQYEDNQFACDNSTLTEHSNSSCSSWSRPCAGSELIKNGYSPMDIRQGMCGNCYFLSALSVIGEKNFNKVLMLDDERFKGFEEERKKCGAYIVRFFYAGDEQYVIVDDRLPMCKAGKGEAFLFASSEDENEIWPQIIEKAYAKYYGGFGNIEGGKVAYAVMELTGGQPEEIELKQFQDNTDQFWNDLLSYQKMGYILGAGSPAHEMGDRAVSEEGIVQGHAYSVLSVQDLDGNRLVQLRNPHGNESAEWSGDWGDRSYLWNDRLKKLAGCEFGADGMFWMDVEDFVYEYRALYVCRTFPSDIWTSVPKINSGWVGKRAAGLPTKKFPKAQMQNNPHYGIRVTKKCNLYVSLTILDKDPENTKYGKYPIYFMCQRNDGERIRGRSSDKMVGQSGMPIPLTTVTNELNLNASSFPYTFSLMLATTEQGGEAMYCLNMWCSDKNVKIVDDIDIK